MTKLNRFFLYCLLILGVQPCLRSATWIIDAYGGGAATSLEGILTNTSVQSGDTILLMAGQTFTGEANRDILFAPGYYEFTELVFGRTGDSYLPDPVIDLQYMARLFIIAEGFTITTNNLFITNGTNIAQPIFQKNRAPGTSNGGGSICNFGTYHAYMCTFSGNSIIENSQMSDYCYGGAISSVGNLILTSCDFYYNNAKANESNGVAYGGAVYTDGVAAIGRCMFSGNMAESPYNNGIVYGGALYNGGTISIADCDFYGNRAVTDENNSALSAGGALFTGLAPYGAGSLNSVSLTCFNCTFSNNSSTGNASRGGAVVQVDAEMTVSNCLFCYNETYAEGGGALCNWSYNNTATLTFEACTFEGNIADNGGGGAVLNINQNNVYNVSANMTASGCVLVKNYAFFGGAIYNNGYGDNAKIHLNNCGLSQNYALYGGGAVYNGTSLIVDSCTFDNNADRDSGGALINYFATATVSLSTFNNNTASHGGAIYSINGAPGTLYLYNDIFISCTGINGGVLYNNNDMVYATGCTFLENQAENGGVLYNEGASAQSVLHCNRFFDNDATVSGDAICNVSAYIVDAENNWWGSNANPAMTPNLLYPEELVDADPWSIASIVTTPSVGGSSVTITFSSSCIPDGTPVGFATSGGITTPSSSEMLDNSSSTVVHHNPHIATVCATIGPDYEDFTLCVTVPPDFSFAQDGVLDISTSSTVIYSLDWYRKYGTVQQPLLAAGGASRTTKSCEGANLFVYNLDNTCVEDEGERVNSRVVAIADEKFDGDIVYSVRWCKPLNPLCPIFPYLGVGGTTGKLDPHTNARIYYIDPTGYALESYAYAPTNSLSAVRSVAWIPACDCSMLAVGGEQISCDNFACNIIAYRKGSGTQALAPVDQTLFDTNITSLDWCKTDTVPVNLCAYLAVGATGTVPCNIESADQIAVYKGSFCKGALSTAPCQR